MDPRIARSRRALHSALLAIVERGEEASVSAICRESGLNRGTFYLHYDDIAELVQDVARSLVKDVVGPWQSLIDTAEFEPAEFEAKSTAFIGAYLEHVRENRAFYSWVLGPQGSWAAVKGLLDEFAAAIVAGLSRSAPDGAERLEEQDAWIADLLAGSLFGVVVRWATAPPRAGAAAVAAWLWAEMTVHPVGRFPSSS
ncbi:TetR/AcrR family transcriptional regulator [Microbacterium sp. ZW T5_45]|uniref:TetR/AcrR family transcriptional regulator n=1 Tax=Microbacterium sp. ZW T5_45 TaxID=3378080 RepID=UPI003852213F